MRTRRILQCWITLLAAAALQAQTTQGIITGRVIDSRTGAALAGARVRYRNSQNSESGLTLADSLGRYSLPSLPPGPYVIRAEQREYQAREMQSLELNVAARLEIDFSLRPLREALEPGDYNSALLPDESAILPVIGPDLEAGRSAPLEATAVQSAIRQPSLSYVIDPREIGEVPLSARNVYALMTTLPGVTAAQVTGRGLQISANGQRASSSNYLLDGMQNNDFLNTGAFTPTAPETIQEYRVSTSNYSAEYGQTGGFVANAVTRAGGSAFHGTGYAYFDNQALDANTFQNNANSLERNPFKQLYLGYSVGGPIVRDRLFFSSAFEQLRSRSRKNPVTNGALLPARLRQCLGTSSSSPILDLYDRFPLKDPANAVDLSPNGPPCTDFALYTYAPPISEDRSLILERLDYRSSNGVHRLMARVSISRTTQPDYFPSIYQGLSEKLTRDSSGVLLSYVRSFGPDVVNDLRLSWSASRIETLRPHSEIPLLQVFINAVTNPTLVYDMPSAANPLEFGARGNQWEMADGVTWTRGRHVLTAGGDLLLRRPQYLLSYLDQGLYNFNDFSSAAAVTSLKNFAAGVASYYELPLSRPQFQNNSFAPAPPRTYDQYSSNQFSVYAQDNVKVTRRFGLNFGVRYESFGTLLDSTTARGFLQPGPGDWIGQRLAAADPNLLFEKSSAYRPDQNNWAGRFGVSYSPWIRTALRAGFGVFYDRHFDNLLLDARNDTVSLGLSNEQSVFPAVAAGKVVNFQQPVSQLFQSGTPRLIVPPLIRAVSSTVQLQGIRTIDARTALSDPLEMLWVDQNLRTPYVQSWFGSLQQRITDDFDFELNTSGSLARKLISSDLVNRACSLVCSPANLGRLNDAFPDILYRSNSGSSDYAALGFVARYHSARTLFQLSYTYSHSIDNQSDPMLSDVFNLAFTNLDTLGAAQSEGLFTRQFDSRADRGSSDFDIRHNLVFYSVWNPAPVSRAGWLGRITANWTLAEVVGIRSGLPYSLFAKTLTPATGGGILADAREDLAPGVDLSCTVGCAGPGGQQLVNLGALRTPGAGQIGALGRNALAGPGFWNVDLSLKRSFAFAPLGEAGRIQASISAFNAFNHSNLGFPNSSGFALYGPTQNQTEFPAALPVFPSPRRIQMQVKVVF